MSISYRSPKQPLNCWSLSVQIHKCISTLFFIERERVWYTLWYCVTPKTYPSICRCHKKKIQLIRNISHIITIYNRAKCVAFINVVCFISVDCLSATTRVLQSRAHTLRDTLIVPNSVYLLIFSIANKAKKNVSYFIYFIVNEPFWMCTVKNNIYQLSLKLLSKV